MATKKSAEGVGKKIVEALKKQSAPIIEEQPFHASDVSSLTEEDLEPQTISKDPVEEVVEDNENSMEAIFDSSMASNEPQNVETPFLDQAFEDMANFEEQKPYFQQAQPLQPQPQQSAPSVAPIPQMNFSQEREVKSDNVKVLAELISKLPPGISKQTGAQIIRQTMEALGISMKSVLGEAQQMQESVSSSSNECLNAIQDCKKQIQMLEKQVQRYHKQYNALNELISLFVQTGM